MHAIKKIKKGTYIEIQHYFHNMSKFYDSLYGLQSKGIILMFVMGTSTLKKTVKLDLWPTVVKLHYVYHYDEETFVSFIR